MKKQNFHGLDLIVDQKRIDTEFGSIDRQFLRDTVPGDTEFKNFVEFLKLSIDFYLVIDLVDEKVASGKVVKTDNLKQFDLGQTIYFTEYQDTKYAHVKAVHNLKLTPEPKHKTPKTRSSNKGRKQRPLTTVNGKLSDAGYAYFQNKMDKLIQNDPANMAEALWRIRKEIKQRPRDLKDIIDDVAQIYAIDRNLLENRNRSRMAFWSYAKRK